MLAHYKLVERIGEGAMGVVFKAYEESLGRHVAVKILSQRLSSDREFVQRFFSEARAIGALNDPNIIQIYLVSQQSETLFSAMELVEGKSLERMLDEHGKLPEREALDYIRQAAYGLQHAHEQGIIHRDIKPANLMITPKGIVKVTDFGLAKQISSDKKITTTITAMGSPLYMSPEQAEGRPVDHRSDIYSLGATLFHLLAGRPLYVGETPMDIMMQQVQRSVPNIRQFNSSVSFAVERMMLRMLEKTPSQRYQSYQDLLGDLEPLALARSSTLRTMPVRRPHDRALVIVLLGLVIVLGWLLWTKPTRLNPIPPPQPTGQIQPPQSNETASNPATEVEGPIPPALPGATDLLALIEPVRDSIRGKWRITDGVLRSDSSPGTLLEIPYQPPDEYDYRIVFRRRAKPPPDLNMILSHAGHSFNWVMGGWGNSVAGFEVVGDRRADDNLSTIKRSQILSDRIHTAEIQVRQDHLKVYLDGELISQLATDYSNLSILDMWKLRDGKHLGLGTYKTATMFYRVELREVSGHGKPTHAAPPLIPETSPK